MGELIAVGCLLVGAWCLFEGIRAVVLGLLSRTWPEATGSVKAAKTVKKLNSEGDEVSREELEYSYSVDRKPYRGTRIRFGIPRALSWSAPSRAPSRPGESVPVYYSPSWPSISALRRGVSPFVILTIAAGAFIGWLGIQWFVGGL